MLTKHPLPRVFLYMCNTVVLHKYMQNFEIRNKNITSRCDESQTLTFVSCWRKVLIH